VDKFHSALKSGFAAMNDMKLTDHKTEPLEVSAVIKFF
jgi:hypothetical protein